MVECEISSQSKSKLVKVILYKWIDHLTHQLTKHGIGKSIEEPNQELDHRTPPGLSRICKRLDWPGNSPIRTWRDIPIRNWDNLLIHQKSRQNDWWSKSWKRHRPDATNPKSWDERASYSSAQTVSLSNCSTLLWIHRTPNHPKYQELYKNQAV